MQLLLKIKIR